MKLYFPSDRIKITYKDMEKLEELSFVVSPLSHAQRIKIAAKGKTIEGKPIVTIEQMVETLRNAIKDVIGFKDMNGDDIKPEFDDTGLLTEEFAEALYEAISGHILNVAALKVANRNIDGVSELEGVEIATLPKHKPC